MSRPPRSDRLTTKGRPKRRAAATHFFKYQLANDPNRAEENALKKALQESLEEQYGRTNPINITSSTNSSDVSRSNNSSSSNESLGSVISANPKRTRSSYMVPNTDPVNKRAKLNQTNGYRNNFDSGNSSLSIESSPNLPHITRAIKTYSRSQNNTGARQQSDGDQRSPHIIKHTHVTGLNVKETQPKILSQASVSKSTQTSSVSDLTPSNHKVNNTSRDSKSPTKSAKDDLSKNPEVVQTPTQDQYLKFKRESKNYAYVKMTALKVSTQKSPSSNSKSSNSKKPSPKGILHNNSTNGESFKSGPKPNTIDNNSTFAHSSSSKISDNSSDTSIKNGLKHDNKSITKHDIKSSKSNTNISSKILPQNGINALDNNELSITTKNMQGPHIGKINIPKQDLNIQANIQGSKNDCSLDDTLDLSDKKNQANVKLNKKRLHQGSWSLLGVPEEKVVFLRNDEPSKRLICYPAIKHIEGDVIQVRDSVLLRSGARKTDLPFIAKVCAFWEDAETGGVMMSLFWYYRPEHTEEGRKPHHLTDEIFASRHRDVDSVECIEEKCYVLTFNEYCRYRKRCKMEQVNTTWSLTDVTIPVSNESYPRQSRIPDSDVNPELIFCCRQIYDSRMKRLVKNPLINPKYGHI